MTLSLPPRCKWCLRSSGMLHDADRHYLPTFRENLLAPSSRIKQSKNSLTFNVLHTDLVYQQEDHVTTTGTPFTSCPLKSSSSSYYYYYYHHHHLFMQSIYSHLISCTLYFGFNYEINYQLDAIEYLFALSSFSSTCFGLTRLSSGAIGVTISYKCSVWCPWFLPGNVSVLRSVCAVGVLHCYSTHTPQDRHLTRKKPRTPYATSVRIVTPIAPEDGRVSPKHVELKELKANKYSIASSW